MLNQKKESVLIETTNKLLLFVGGGRHSILASQPVAPGLILSSGDFFLGNNFGKLTEIK